MPSIINASTSSTGLLQSADASGILQLQSNGTTGLTVNANANVTISNSLFVSGNEVQPLVSGTSQTTTSGTSIDFTSIPSWVRRITVMFNGVSTNGTSIIQIQVGSGSFVTSGYFANYGAINLGTGQANITTGIPVYAGASAASVSTGHIILTLIGSNTWIASGVVLYTNNAGDMYMIAGNTPSLAGALDRVRLTTVNGTDTFDAGSVNILYE
jgi:hypothetical protein